MYNKMEGDLLNKQRKLLIFTAKSLHMAEFDSNALAVFKSAIDMDARLTPKHQDFLFDIIRSLLNPMRNSLKQLTESFNKETRERHTEVADLVSGVIKEHFEKLELICQDILSIVDQQLIPGSPTIEAKVNYIRLQGDLYRYMYEYAPQERKDLYRIRCESVYEDATKIALSQLPPHSLARLSLVLNRSLFLAEVLKRVPEAVSFAETEVNRLLSTNTELSEALYQKAMVFTRKLRDKIIQWKI